MNVYTIWKFNDQLICKVKRGRRHPVMLRLVGSRLPQEARFQFVGTRAHLIALSILADHFRESDEEVLRRAASSVGLYARFSEEVIRPRWSASARRAEIETRDIHIWYVAKVLTSARPNVNTQGDIWPKDQ